MKNNMRALKESEFWIRFLGFVEVFTGIVGILAGFLSFDSNSLEVSYLIGGGVSLVLGVFLLQVASALESDQEYEAGRYLRKFFKLSAILALLSLILFALGFFIMIPVIGL